MHFQIGEKVAFLNESGGGIVRKISNFIYFVEDETGFERPFRINELAKIHGTDYKLRGNEMNELLVDGTIEEVHHSVRKEMKTGYLKPIDVWEIDLHIESITESHSGLTNGQILIKQLSIFKSFLNDARKKNIRKLIVIHGVGEGVLKEEVRAILKKIEGAEFFDASYQEYGKGATQVEFRYNV